MNRSIWCFAQGSRDSWEAICVDFDIAVQGRTFDEVKSSLGDAIGMYVAAAENEEPEVRDRLLSRRAPWTVRAKLTVALLRASFRHRGDGGSNTAGFSMPCHA